MAEMIAQGLLRSRLLPPQQLVLSHYREDRLRELDVLGPVLTTTSNREAFDGADLAILCIRPQGMGDLLAELGDLMTAEKPLMSIAAGLPITYYQERIGGEVPFIRAMPTFFGQIK